MKRILVVFLFLSIGMVIGCGQLGVTATRNTNAITDIQLRTAEAIIKTATAQKMANTKPSTAVVQKTSTIRQAAATATPAKQVAETRETVNEILRQLLLTPMSPAYTPTHWPTPWGPKATITARMDELTPCIPLGSQSCVWNYKIYFESTNSIGGKIYQVQAVFYSSRDKKSYVRGNITGISKAETIIPAWGSGLYSSSITSTVGKVPDFRGGSVHIWYYGADDNGNPFKGEVTSRLGSD